MRDSFGGVFMFRLMLVFIFIFVAFSAVSLNYAKSFRIKNRIIDFIEQNEITELSGYNFENNLSKLDAILQDANYNKTCNSGNGQIENAEGIINGYCHNGIVILKTKEQEIEGTKSKKIHYTIITSVDWNLGALNKILALGGDQENSQEYVTGTWKIKGEATVITNK